MPARNVLALLFCLILPSVAFAEQGAGTAPASVQAPPAVKVPPPSEAPPPPSVTRPEARDRRASAYVIPKKTWAIDAGLFGVNSSELYASLGVTYGLGGGFDVGVNLAHVSTGLFNAQVKWNFFESKHAAVALIFAPAYIHGDWVWIASQEFLLGGLDIWLFPIAAVGSFPVTDWLQLDLQAQYNAGIVTGNIRESSVVLDANLVGHQFVVTPTLRFHVLDRSSFYVRPRLPVYTAVPGTVEAEVEIADGVVVGGGTGGTIVGDLSDQFSIELGARSALSRHTYLDLGFVMSAQPHPLYSTEVFPRVSFEGRF